MSFNSLEFAIFLPVVFALYWFVFQRSLKLQNALIVVASFLFYGWWDWRFLGLLLISSAVDFAVGLALEKEDRPGKRKLLLGASLAANLGMLGFFKYYDFFVESFREAFTLFGVPIAPSTLHIVLPVGISFYTFQTLSYGIDIYRRNLRATRDPIAFLAFVSFFPQLVAGPIERATNLLPQFFRPRTFAYEDGVEGAKYILWGLFKKLVIADNCAAYANYAFDGAADHRGSTLALGAVCFGFQIYGDFSGYSDMAIGIARLFGFSLMRNFAHPYFSRDIAEFWRRWHISLSTWFRDYLYLPLGGSRGSRALQIRNVVIVFAVSGLWHGANWTFVLWGLLNALYFVPLLLLGKHRANLDVVAQGRILPTPRELFSVLGTFVLTSVAWVFFRAESVTHAVVYLRGMASASLFSAPQGMPVHVAILLVAFVAVEWVTRESPHALARVGVDWPRPVRWAMYLALVALTRFFVGEPQEFIYFQF